jgi:excisionase family DNA binding protein
MSHSGDRNSVLKKTEDDLRWWHLPEWRVPIEPYVSPEAAADFLGVRRLKVIRMARSGVLPAHPLGGGRRRQWRFKLSELDKHMQHGIHTADPPVRQ